MVVRFESGLEMEDEVSHNESSSDESEDEVEEEDSYQDDDDDATQPADGDVTDNEEEVVEIKGTKFNVSQAAKDAIVEESDEEEEESDDDEQNEDADDEDQESEPEDDETEDKEDAAAAGKSGWADAMAKVLNMGKDSEQAPALLSKAKLDNFQIKEKTGEEGPREQRDSVKRLIKKEMEEKGRVKPDIVRDRAREKMLSKLATRGVVQLFNAVKEQQKDIKSKLDEVGGSVRKREKSTRTTTGDGCGLRPWLKSLWRRPSESGDSATPPSPPSASKRASAQS